MSFTFDASLPTDRDKVRALVGDTVDAGHKVENETITAVLTWQTNPVLAAAIVADMIAATFAGAADKAIGKTKIDASRKFDQYTALAAGLRARGSLDGGGMTLDPMVVGGISDASRVDLVYGDSDRIQPSFTVGQDDNPLAQPAPRSREEDV